MRRRKLLYRTLYFYGNILFAFFIFSVVKSKNDYSCIVNWRNAICIFILMLGIPLNGYGQEKFSPRLRRDVNRKAVEGNFSISIKDSIRFLKQYGSKVEIHKRYGSSNILSVKVSRDVVMKEMAKDSNILFIDQHRKAREEAGVDYINLAFNRITKAHHYFSELLSANVYVSIKEQGFDPLNIDLINRSFSTPVSPILISQHATAMATRIAGGGNSSANGQGVAPAARITSSDFENLLPDADLIFQENDIHLQNHSYGVDIENYYGNEAVAYDLQIFQNPTLVHVFSVGNLGQSVPETGTYENLMQANLSGNFKQAKNVITVNAVDTSFVVNVLNSRGPAYDGRLKPELTAYGQGGTSDAAALVSGVSALLQKKYQLVNSELPLASTIKAILIASADDIGTKGIDFTYGYGSVNAHNALQLTELQQTSTFALASLEQITMPITIASPSAELRVAVVWTDVPAIQNADYALVHDIDAYIQNGSDQYFPWVLKTTANTDSLAAVAKRKKDHLNTVEYITIDNPPPGSYQLIITAPELTTSKQIVSVAYWIEDQNPFQWDYPSGSDVMHAGKRQSLFWNSNTNQKGELSCQLNGSDFNIINSNIALKDNFHWTPPDTLSTARLKMKIGSDEFLSDEFLISPQQALHVGYNCDVDFLLTWNAIPGVDSYSVYALGDMYLEKVLDVNDTTAIISKNYGDLYFAVAPSLNSAHGFKSETINYTTQGSLCYINLFESIRYDADRVEIHLNLSTLFQIDSIVIHKTVNDQQVRFATLDPLMTTQFTLYDTDLISGWMYFQAELFFADGTSLKSDMSNVFIETKGKAVLYPNPVTDDSDLTIITEGNGLKIRILDRQGKLLLVKDLELFSETFDVSELLPGLYLYQLQENDRIKDSGRFIKL
ncbi:MAG: S8 family peptidase [Chryseolinea sp.]